MDKKEDLFEKLRKNIAMITDDYYGLKFTNEIVDPIIDRIEKKMKELEKELDQKAKELFYINKN